MAVKPSQALQPVSGARMPTPRYRLKPSELPSSTAEQLQASLEEERLRYQIAGHTFRPNLAFEARRCGDGHRLEICLCDALSRVCNDCHQPIAEAYSFRCEQCDFDLCKRCFTRPSRVGASTERSTTNHRQLALRQQQQRRIRTKGINLQTASPRLLYGVLPPVRLAERFRLPNRQVQRGRLQKYKGQPDVHEHDATDLAAAGSDLKSRAESCEEGGGEESDFGEESRSEEVPAADAASAAEKPPIVLSKADQWRLEAAMAVASTMGNRDIYKVKLGPQARARAKEACLGNVVPPDLPVR